ncbi:hypothetical protein WJX77_002182 [Trebouxia sp. C0004]
MPSTGRGVNSLKCFKAFEGLTHGKWTKALISHPPCFSLVTALTYLSMLRQSTQAPDCSQAFQMYHNGQCQEQRMDSPAGGFLVEAKVSKPPNLSARPKKNHESNLSWMPTWTRSLSPTRRQKQTQPA